MMEIRDRYSNPSECPSPQIYNSLSLGSGHLGSKQDPGAFAPVGAVEVGCASSPHAAAGRQGHSLLWAARSAHESGQLLRLLEARGAANGPDWLATDHPPRPKPKVVER